MAYSCCFGLRGNMDFPDFLQKSFITSTTGAFHWNCDSDNNPAPHLIPRECVSYTKVKQSELWFFNGNGLNNIFLKFNSFNNLTSRKRSWTTSWLLCGHRELFFEFLAINAIAKIAENFFFLPFVFDRNDDPHQKRARQLQNEFFINLTSKNGAGALV